jgi:hypothetical protein
MTKTTCLTRLLACMMALAYAAGFAAAPNSLRYPSTIFVMLSSMSPISIFANVRIMLCDSLITCGIFIFSRDLYHLFIFSFMTRALPSVLNATDLPIEYVRNVLNTDHVFSTAHFGVLASEANMLPGKGELLFRCLVHWRRRNFCCSLTKHAW